MTVRRCLVAAIAAACVVFGGGLTAAAELSPEQRARAMQELKELTAGCGNATDCVRRSAAVALEAPIGSPLQIAARESTLGDFPRAQDYLLKEFPGAKAAAQLEILSMYRDGWDSIKAGVDFRHFALIREGLESPHHEVRVAAARLMAERPIHGVAHAAIDAADLDPSLTLAALRAIALTREPVAARWVVGRLADPDPGVRQQAQLTLLAIGRPAAERVLSRLDDPDPAWRSAAMDTFLLMVGVDDVPRLHSWLGAHRDQDPQLAARVEKAIAELEAGRYKPQPPEPPPLNL